MKHQYYKVYFKASKEVYKGIRERKLIAVYLPKRDETTGKHLNEAQRIERGTAALEAEGYTNIEYGSTILDTELIFG